LDALKHIEFKVIKIVMETRDACEARCEKQ